MAVAAARLLLLVVDGCRVCLAVVAARALPLFSSVRLALAHLSAASLVAHIAAPSLSPPPLHAQSCCAPALSPTATYVRWNTGTSFVCSSPGPCRPRLLTTVSTTRRVISYSPGHHECNALRLGLPGRWRWNYMQCYSTARIRGPRLACRVIAASVWWRLNMAMRPLIDGKSSFQWQPVLYLRCDIECIAIAGVLSDGENCAGGWVSLAPTAALTASGRQARRHVVHVDSRGQVGATSSIVSVTRSIN